MLLIPLPPQRTDAEASPAFAALALGGTHAPESTLDLRGTGNFQAYLGEGRPLGNPTGTPTASGSATGGTLAAGTYRYAYTESTVVGETALSPASADVVLTGATSSVLVTVPMRRRGVTSVAVYRSADGGATWGRVNDNLGAGVYFATKWVDTGAAAGVSPPASDTTRMPSFTVGASVKYFLSHPDQATVADFCLLTGDPSTDGAYAADIYGIIFARTFNGNSFQSEKVPAGTGSHFAAVLASDTEGGASSAVFRVEKNGCTVLAPVSLADQGAGGTVPLSITATFPATITTANSGFLCNFTGAGSSAFSQTGALFSFNAGYTGASTTYAMRATNATASSGKSAGGYYLANGASALNVGCWGEAQGGTRNLGGYFTTGGADPAVFTWPSGVTRASLGLSNGTNTDDFLTCWDGSGTAGAYDAVFRVMDGGNVTLKSPSGVNSCQLDIQATSGGAKFFVKANAGNFIDIGSTNGVPVRVFVNNVVRWTFGTDATLTPASKQTVTGSRGGNAALASLLTALAGYGFITDSTTA